MYSDPGERNVRDMRQWNPLVGKIFWQTHPDHSKQGRTIRMRFNIFADKITPQITDWNACARPDGIEEINPRLLSSLTMQNAFSSGLH